MKSSKLFSQRALWLVLPLLLLGLSPLFGLKAFASTTLSPTSTTAANIASATFEMFPSNNNGTFMIYASSTGEPISTTSQDFYIPNNACNGSPCDLGSITTAPPDSSFNLVDLMNAAGTGYYHILDGGTHGWACAAGNTYTECEGGLYSPSTFNFYYTAAPVENINFAYPIQGSTTPDFSNWVLNISGTYSGTTTLEVAYGLSSSTLNYTDTSTIYSAAPITFTSPYAIPKTQSLWYPTLPDPVEWYAEGILYTSSSAIFTPIESFFVSPNEAAPPSSTSSQLAAPYQTPSAGETSSTIANPYTNCNATSSGFWDTAVVDTQNAICTAMTYLFIPNTGQNEGLQSDFKGLQDTIVNKPPIGYFTLIKNDLSGLSEETSSVDLMNATATAAFAPLISPIYTGIQYLLWFIFVLWLFNRLRHFNFTNP